MMRLRNILGSGAVLPFLLLLSWAASVRLGFLDARIWSSPEQVLASAWVLLQDGSLATALAASLKRDLAGFAIGAGLGLPLGLLLARVRLADRLLSPTLNATRQVALFAWVPFLSLWLGNGEQGRIAFIALAAFFPVLLNSHLGAAHIEARHLEVARVLCLRPHRVFLPNSWRQSSWSCASRVFWSVIAAAMAASNSRAPRNRSVSRMWCA